MSTAAQLKLRAVIVALAALAAWIVLAAASAVPAQASATCTWGGTPLAPTGIFTASPGVTNTPSPGPIDFKATGKLAGDCSGRMVFTGVIGPGATCSEGIFDGTVTGLPGVVRFEGFDLSGLAPSRLYDRAGNLVGSENAQLLTIDNAPFSACGTPEGFTRGTFSSVIELFG